MASVAGSHCHGSGERQVRGLQGLRGLQVLSGAAKVQALDLGHLAVQHDSRLNWGTALTALAIAWACGAPARQRMPGYPIRRMLDMTPILCRELP